MLYIKCFEYPLYLSVTTVTDYFIYSRLSGTPIKQLSYRIVLTMIISDRTRFCSRGG